MSLNEKDFELHNIDKFFLAYFNWCFG